MFGQRLKELREAAELSQSQLADKAGVAVRNIENWEQGLSEPRFSVVLRIAEALGVSCEAFRVLPTEQ